MEIENHKEEVPFEHYLDKFYTLDPKEAAQRLNILYDENAKKFQLRFLGHLYEVEYPDFHVTVLDKPQEDMEKDLLMTSLPAQTFIMRYLLEGQYIASSGKFMTFREVPTYGELYIQPFTGRCIKRLTYGFGYKLKAFSEAMEKIPGCEKIDMGDVLVIHDTGAHGFSMGYNYNGKLKSAEVLLKEDGSTQLIRRAETPADYFATFDCFDIGKKLIK